MVANATTFQVDLSRQVDKRHASRPVKVEGETNVCDSEGHLLPLLESRENMKNLSKTLKSAL